ncbi:MAG: hypothetical protein ACN6P1_20835 [Pseudomonas sp.]|uniref:hypothetical protein n=1 Tax=Pseudomonas sp. TaxID=306 RepID=UPI003D0F209B
MPRQTEISAFDSDHGYCQWPIQGTKERQADIWKDKPVARQAYEKLEKKSQKAKGPENLLVFWALGIAKVAVKKRFEPVSVACQSVPNPLNTGFPLPLPARFVAIRLYDFDTFSTLNLHAAR